MLAGCGRPTVGAMLQVGLAHGWTQVTTPHCPQRCSGSQGWPARHLRLPLRAGCRSPGLKPPAELISATAEPGALKHGVKPARSSRHFLVSQPTSDFSSTFFTDLPGLALGRPRPLRPAAELHEHFRQLVWLYAADPLSDEARPCPL